MPTLTEALRTEYRELFDTCAVRPQKTADVDRLLDRIVQQRANYDEVERRIEVPWFVVGAIHCMESTLNFNRHLHNGDPLTARTVQEPPGRPREGNPPFTWLESALDALRLHKLHQWSDWTVPGMLFQLESYNGWGYRRHHPEVLTPYLWSFSNHYESGKYVKDGVFSPTAKSSQAGAAVLIRRLAERGVIAFGADERPRVAPATTAAPLVRYAPNPPEPIEEAAVLQEFLNRLPGLFVRVDGVPGPRTSEALYRATGSYLPGDPREKAKTAAPAMAGKP